MMPTISVVIPAYNHEKFIGPAIESVLEQSHQKLELIIVDDGSTDRTAEVIKRYDDPRITYYYQENQDAFNTLNRGMGLASGEYISILNSDDIYARNRLERLLEIQKLRKVQCLFTDVIPISDSGDEFVDPKFGWNVWHQKNRSFLEKTGDLYLGFLNGNYMVTTSNLFMTKEAVKVVGNFCSLRYLHDYDFIFRMMLAFPGGIEYVKDEKLLYYRIHDGNTLGEAAIIGREQDKELIKKYMLHRLPEEYKDIVNTGTDRLVELEQELNAVRQTIAAGQGFTIRQSVKFLIKALLKKKRSIPSS
ncbi:MAG: glycosyltransferase [Bacteroidetes bacterium]|nr:glycosyltransferase [Bacteroidota bacterium]